MDVRVERIAIASLVRQSMKDAQATLSALVEADIHQDTWSNPNASELFREIYARVKAGQRFHHGLAKLSKAAQELAQWAVNLPDAEPLSQALNGLAVTRLNTAIADGLQRASNALKMGDYGTAQAIARVVGDIAPVAAQELMGLGAVATEMLAQARVGRRSVPTGISDLDRFVGGLPSNLTVIGAQPGVGKSGFLASLATSMADTGVKVGILSLEDSSPWLARRLAAKFLRVPVRDILHAKDKPNLLERIESAKTFIADRWGEKVFMADAVKPSIQQVTGMMERMIYSKKVGAIFIDHIGELGLNAANRFDLEVGNALSAIRGVATHHGVPAVVFAHTRREQSQDGKPKATDFANSADMERKARLALALKREPESEELEVHVVKNTEGPSGGVVTLGFDLESGMLR